MFYSGFGSCHFALVSTFQLRCQCYWWNVKTSSLLANSCQTKESRKKPKFNSTAVCGALGWRQANKYNWLMFFKQIIVVLFWQPTFVACNMVLCSFYSVWQIHANTVKGWYLKWPLTPWLNFKDVLRWCYKQPCSSKCCKVSATAAKECNLSLPLAIVL